ncbi:MAG: hypothetical protein KBC22_01805 [Candidatus Pacebacteria bacterium]|nr:hypothetical protein [Candidatus Paceibacterota bacterium]
MENFPKQKDSAQLERQAANGALFSGSRFMMDNMPNLLTLSEKELKENYPDHYQEYLTVLRSHKERLPATTRRFCIKINDTNTNYVVKALESSFEGEIAKRVADLKIGPEQFEALPGTIRELFIEGTPLLKLSPEEATPELMKDLGTQVAEHLETLHKNNILVNDQILTNDFGKSHLIIDESKKVKFVDFGASIDITEYPNISDEAVYSLMRTDPMAGFILPQITQENFKSEVQKYRDVILSQYPTKEAIVEIKDMQLLREGLHFLGQRMPNIQSFAQGVQGVFNS